jgi:hypothetical protein
MKKLLIAGIILVGLGMTSCDKCACTARDINGDALYEVNGQSTCEDQIQNEGDYCDCDC